MFRITKQRLKELIIAAYEEGWSGCPELKDEYAESVVEKMHEEIDLSGTSSLTVSPVSLSISTTDNLISQHYSYYGSDGMFGSIPLNDTETI